MKKLIFAAAAVAGMGAFALESANVVGFQDVAAPCGSCMRTPTFQVVDGEGYDLTKVVVDGGDGIGDVVAQMMGEGGAWDGEYYYLNENAGVDTGWYKDAFGDEPVAEGEVVLAPGKAFFLTSANNSISMTTSGEVKKGEYVINFEQGSDQVGNGLPVDVDLTAIVVDGGDGIGDIVAQTMSEGGEWNGEYYYLNENAGVDTGWYKDAFGDEPVAAGEVVLTPGEAVFFTSSNNAVTIKLPAVL